MSDILKGPYQLSLWEQKPGGLEKLEMIIGSDSMSSPYKAQNVVIKTKVNTEKILTFTLYSRYFDNEIGEFRNNPFCDFLKNECLLKLHRGNIPEKGWHEFIIKDIQENSEAKTFTYIAKDAHQIEMAKTGYGISFSSELMNNMGTATSLAEKVFENTDWTVQKEDSDKFWGNTVEILYKATLKNDLISPMTSCIRQAKVGSYELYYKEPMSTVKYPKAGQEVYIPYSSFQNCLKTNSLQILWDETNTNAIDEKGIIYTANSYILDLNHLSKKPTKLEDVETSIFKDNDLGITLEITTVKGDFLQNKNNSFYISNIDQVVTKGKINERTCYEFSKTKYVTYDFINELVINNENFENTNGWIGKDKAKIQLSYISEDYDKINSGTIGKAQLALIADSAEPGIFYNGAIRSNISYIDKFSVGEKYLLEVNGFWAENANATKEFEIFITEEGKYTENDSVFYKKVSASELSGTASLLLNCKKDISKEGLKQSNIALFIKIPAGTELRIQKLSFYKHFKQGDKIITPTDIPEPETILEKFYIEESELYENGKINPLVKSLEDITYRSLENDETFVPELYGTNYEKITSIEISKSNRFNILQEICEAFECWAKLEVEHYANGAIVPNSKKIYLKNFIGDNKDIGFSYGLNLKSINRQIASDQIVTKLIVEQNNNEHAINGTSSIIRATDNISKSNNLYDFSYYVNQLQLDDSDIDNINEKLRAIGNYNNLIIDINEEIIALENEKFILERDFAVAKELVEALSFEIDNLKKDFFDRTQKNYPSDDITASQKEDGLIKGIVYNIRNKTEQKNQYEEQKAQLQASLNTNKLNLTNKNNSRDSALENVKNLTNSLEREYSVFIQEGTWQSDAYFDDDLYYYDAKNVLSTSAFPKVSYTINVIDITSLSEEFNPYKFKVGDKTYIEDTEFFGWNKSTLAPYREEVVISEIEEHLDSPEQNKITVQNYKTQFEDLFQRISATTQSLQYAMGAYQRAANKITSTNEIDAKTFQNSLLGSVLNLQNMGNLSVSWTKNGLIVKSSDTKTAHKQLRLSNTGLSLSVDGGLTWRTAINGDGIVADEISTGTLNTSKITIKSGDDPTFIWDVKGLRAYDATFNGNVLTAVDYNNFIEFNGKGLKSQRVIYDENHNILSTEVPFYLDAQGNLFLIGNITARDGEIGGWKIMPKYLYSGSVGMSSDNTYSYNQAFWAGRKPQESTNKTGTEIITDLNTKYGNILTLINQYREKEAEGNKEVELNNLDERLCLLFEAYEDEIGEIIGRYMLSLNIDYRIQEFWYSTIKDKYYYYYEIRQKGINHIDQILTKNAKFYVTHGGDLYAQNAAIEGRIDATSGTLQNLIVNGNITISEDGGIYSSNYEPSSWGWKIDGLGAEFNNITIRGALKVASFEYGEVSAVGGIILVRPSTLILKSQLNLIGTEYHTMLEVEDASQFAIGDKCVIGSNVEAALGPSGDPFYYQATSSVGTILNINTDFGKQVITFEENLGLADDVKNHVLVSLCKNDGTDNVFIAINSSNNNAFAIPKSITIGENLIETINSEEVWRRKTRVLLGEFPAWTNKGPVYNYLQQNGKYGLYAEGAYISGIIASCSANGTRSAGLWTESNITMCDGPWNDDKGNVIFWAGQSDSTADLTEVINNASVKIDDKGHLYARGAFIEGEVKVTSGTIGGVSFDAVAEKTFECDIEKTSNGLICHIYCGGKEMTINGNVFSCRGINYKITFQWKKDSENIANSNVQTLETEFTAGEHVYSCEITIEENQ